MVAGTVKKEPPSILTQAKRQGWSCAFYNFRKAKEIGVDFYNPSLVRRRDGLWLITRRSVQRQTFTYGFNDLMAFRLDDNHLPQFGIKIPVAHAATNEHFEDPRVTVSPDGRYFLSACNFIIFGGSYWTGAHQVLLEVNEHWQTVRRHDPVYGKNGKNVRSNKGDEKNWLWFFHEDELHMIYMTDPHTVVRFDTKSLEAKQQWVTHQIHAKWEHGHIRGGTAPVRIGDEYFSFFHSSLQWRDDGKRRYFMGAYAFEARPPFRMTRMTPKPLLTGSQLDPWQEGKPLVVFPCSAILDIGLQPVKVEQKDQFFSAIHPYVWTVSLGVNDLVSAWVQIEHKDLLGRLDDNIVFKGKSSEKTSVEAAFK